MTKMSTIDAVENFNDELKARGLGCDNSIIADGKIHRYHVEGDKARSQNGWYVLHDDDYPAGIFGSWKTGEQFTWSLKTLQDLSPQKRKRHQERMAKAKQEGERIRLEIATEAAIRAQTIWDAAKPAPPDHPYLVRKQVKAHNVRIYEGTLVIPIYGESVAISTLQFIKENGEKRFLTGGSKHGNYFPIGELCKTIYVAEGFATGATTYEATGSYTIVAFDAGNLRSVAERIRREYPDAKIIIACDNDSGTEGNPGFTKGKEAAQAVDGEVVYPVFQCVDGNGKPPTDFNDLMILEGVDVVREQLRPVRDVEDEQEGGGGNGPDPIETELDRLASLTALEYALARKKSAKKLDIGLGALDSIVKTRRMDLGQGKTPQGKEIVFDEPVPFDEPVDGGALLKSLVDLLEKYLVLPIGAATATALLTLHAYALDCFGVNPRLAILSPEKRCGKTTLMALLGLVMPRPLLCSNISPSAVFRVIERCSPTLFLDEMDSFQDAHEELRGILNSGHTRATAQVIRTVGDDFEPRSFSTWNPTIFAAIGSLPDTLEDRSIVVRMQRKKKSDKVERLVQRVKDSYAFKEEVEMIKRQCMRWTTDHFAELQSAEPDTLEELSDRANDNWSGLFSIAKLCGSEWLTQAKLSALALAGKETLSDTIGEELLRDIRDIFESKKTEGISSQNLCDALVALEEKPWATWSRGKPITMRKIANLLDKYGIKSQTIRESDATAKGYYKAKFEDAWERYLSSSPGLPVSLSNRDTTRMDKGQTHDFQRVANTPCYLTKNNTSTKAGAACDVVTQENQESQREEREEGAERATDTEPEEVYIDI